jgi:hypothetical protein
MLVEGEGIMKRFIILSLAIFFTNSLYALTGSGTELDPYLIQSLADFDEFAGNSNYWNDYIRLETDVNLAERVYTTAVIAPDTNLSLDYFQGIAFTGRFDGNGKKIMNLRINTAGAGNDYLGLFGKIYGSSAQVKNLGIENAVITGGTNSYFLGGLCGYNDSGTISSCYANGSLSGGNNTEYLGGLCGVNYFGNISNCYSSGQVTGGYSSLGGLCGENYYGTISNCYATCSVSGVLYLGGLCGWNWHGTISRCYSSGQVTGVSDSYYLGGLCGENWFGTISDCYATGSVSGINALGGLCGYSYFGMISNCYSSGQVTGKSISIDLGGLCGENGGGTISNCYATGSVTGLIDVGGLCGYNYHGKISNCYSSGQVAGRTGSDSLGGLCGATESGTISNCYSTGLVTGDLHTGGFCGYNYHSGSFTGCFWNTQTSGMTDGISNMDPDPNGVQGKMTAEMKTLSTFTDAGWDFVGETTNGIEDIWLMPLRKDYPILNWQGMNFVDYSAFANAWLSTPVDANWNPLCDLKPDNIIDSLDLQILTEYWLNGL